MITLASRDKVLQENHNSDEDMSCLASVSAIFGQAVTSYRLDLRLNNFIQLVGEFPRLCNHLKNSTQSFNFNLVNSGSANCIGRNLARQNAHADAS
jgi:hypothetical protein